MPQAPEGWDGPWFLYEGPRLFPPDCPAEAANIPFEGVPDPQAIPLTCPTCACGDPTGSCKLPETWTVSSESCQGSGGVLTNFDPPTPWDGTCSADDTIPAGKLCDGKPCVRSISISAPVIEEAACEVQTIDVPPGQAPFSFGPPQPDETFARACAPDGPWPLCKKEEQKVCLPNAGGDFSTCIHRAENTSCPEGWPAQRLFYGDVDDDRTCSACACSEPAGATCLARVDLASNAICEGMPLDGVFVAAGVSSPPCFDLPPGIALASKAAAIFDYQHGACIATGGEQTGSVTLAEPSTFCCLLES